MTYIEFAKCTPILYGFITITQSGITKYGMFKPTWNKWSNGLCYQYYTIGGNRGTGGFTLMYAYKLWKAGRLSMESAMAVASQHKHPTPNKKS